VMCDHEATKRARRRRAVDLTGMSEITTWREGL
jgi:hypothetical protein